MIQHKDRAPLYPGRVTLTPVSGQANTFDLVRADQAAETGTPLDKALLDEFLAASGVTAGTATALTLAQAGFALVDGAVVRLRLHVVPTAPTLNVNSTGAKPVVTSSGKPFKRAAIGSWVTVVYSSALGSFILQGEGGSEGRFGNGPGQISTYEIVLQAWRPSLNGG